MMVTVGWNACKDDAHISAEKWVVIDEEQNYLKLFL
jgi:hypothetical protein